jgi:D-lactate dehydrogenase
MKVTFFSTHNFELPYIEAANTKGFECFLLHERLTEQTVALASGADCIAVFGNDDVSAPIVKALHSMGVKYIALRSAGYNHVDLQATSEVGIRVANVPAYSPYAVAEHTVALILALNRKITRAHSRVREMNFNLDGLVGFDLNGKTVGIIGVGRIGAVLAKILTGFGCRVLGYDVLENHDLLEADLITYTDMDTLCAESDIVSLHVPLMPQTKHMISSDRIKSMKKGVMLINTSRGGLVDTKAVIDALKSQHIGYLGLDVYELEAGIFFHDKSDQVMQDDVLARLMTFNNVLITSHQAFLTDTALLNIATTTFQNISFWANGDISPNELSAG